MMVKCLTVMMVVGVFTNTALAQRGAPTSSRTGGITLQPPESALSQAIVPLMEVWREAVLKRDTPTLVRLALPEYRNGVSAALQNRRSLLYRTLYAQGAPYPLLLKDRKTRIAVFEHHLLAESHNRYATACFFNRDIRWPTSYLALQKMKQPQALRCLDWGFTEGEEKQWYVSYGFAMPD